MEFKHISILLKECIEGLNIKDDGIYIDGTIGGAGHSKEIVKRLRNGLLIGIDQDINALKKSEEVLIDYKDKVKLVHNNFKNTKLILRKLGIDKVDGVLLDLGVSSHQFDEQERGFSYRFNAKLDMRMDRTNKLTAWDVINEYTEEELKRIIKEYGEEKWSSRIAKFIVQEREKKSIDTTFDLVEIIKKAIPLAVRREGPHPAKRTFQAIRIEVNKELEILEKAVKDIVDILNPGGRLCIITFHSLEDRIIKETFKYLNRDCICPKELPICTCNKRKEVNIVTKKPILPSKSEIENNNRARSAKLRIIEKLKF